MRGSSPRMTSVKEEAMTPEHVRLVQQSFANVAPISDQAAVIFYDRLFEVAPSVKPMFPVDMTEQRKKLMATLAVVVNGLSTLEAVLPAARAPAQRHVRYGANPGARPRARSPNAMSAMAPSRSTIPSLAAHCFGRLKRGLAKAGRPKSPRPGPRLTAR